MASSGTVVRVTLGDRSEPEGRIRGGAQVLTAAHAMQTDVETVLPTMGLVDLERQFLIRGLNGFPVVEQGKLIGIVSRSDVVRILSVERSVAEQASDFYRSFEDPARAANASAEAAGLEAAC